MRIRIVADHTTRRVAVYIGGDVWSRTLAPHESLIDEVEKISDRLKAHGAVVVEHESASEGMN